MTGGGRNNSYQAKIDKYSLCAGLHELVCNLQILFAPIAKTEFDIATLDSMHNKYIHHAFEGIILS